MSNWWLLILLNIYHWIFFHSKMRINIFQSLNFLISWWFNQYLYAFKQKYSLHTKIYTWFYAFISGLLKMFRFKWGCIKGFAIRSIIHKLYLITHFCIKFSLIRSHNLFHCTIILRDFFYFGLIWYCKFLYLLLAGIKVNVGFLKELLEFLISYHLFMD